MSPTVLLVLGTLISIVVTRLTSLELHRLQRREESMRVLRWAVDNANDDNRMTRRSGLMALSALLKSPLLDKDDIDFVGEMYDSYWAEDDQE